MLDKLIGARTYILAVLASIVGTYMAVDELVVFSGLGDLPDVPAFILVWLGAGTAASLRAGITNTLAATQK
jgi:hypothetical protein